MNRHNPLRPFGDDYVPLDAVRMFEPVGQNHEPGNGADTTPAAIVNLPVVSASSLAGKVAPPRPWHVAGWIRGRTVTMLAGDGGVGKTILALQLAVATVAGKPWLGLTPEFGPVVYLSAEDDVDELHRRLE